MDNPELWAADRRRVKADKTPMFLHFSKKIFTDALEVPGTEATAGNNAYDKPAPRGASLPTEGEGQ